MAEGFSPMRGNKSSTGQLCERELILKLLGEKRSLLVKIHNERKETLKWRTECEQLREENMQLRKVKTDDCPSVFSLDLSSVSTPQQDTSYGVEIVSLHKKIAVLQRRIQDLKKQNDSLANQKTVLESEVLRLADSLSKLDPELETQLLKEQLQLYEEDFEKEKHDKVSAEGKLSSLNDQIRDCQELISNLNVEVDMYKKAYHREKGDKELLLVQNFEKDLELPVTAGSKYQIPRSRVLPTPQLQVVYPVLDSKEHQESELKRRQQLQRVGVFTRNAPKSPGDYYGDNVEADAFWSS